MGDVLRYSNDIVYKSIKSWMARMIGEIFLIIPEKSLSDSENWIKKAIEGNKVNGTKWLLAHDYLLYAELLKRKGDQLKARESLGKAIEIFKESGADGWVKKGEEKLAAISK